MTTWQIIYFDPFLVTNFDTVKSPNNLAFIKFYFYNTFLNLFNVSSHFSGGIIISWTGSCFSISSLFELVRYLRSSTALYMHSFPINSHVLWTTFLETSSPVSSNRFSYFLANDKNPSFNIFSCSWFYRILRLL